jgi:hypothetical protein
MGVDRKSDSFARLEQIYPNGLAGGYIPNFADFSNLNYNRTPEQIESKRIKDAKKQNWKKAQGAVGKLFKGIDKAGPTVLIDGVISGAEIQGLNLDSIKTLIENNGAIAQMFLGDKGSNFVEQAKKYGITVQRSAMKKLTSLAAKGLNKMQGLAGGYLPNFANPLQAAVGREMAAGVPASQIYIDKSPSLKSAANPMGLMVANRRDEPAGGFQGINRAMREGRDPKMYGAAGGFVPNYAAAGAAPTGADLAPFAGKTVPEATKKIQEDLTDSLKNIVKKYDDQKKELEKSQKELSKRAAIEKDLVKVSKQILDDAKNDLAEAQKRGDSVASRVMLKDRVVEKSAQLDAVTQQRNTTSKEYLSTRQSIRDLPSNKLKEENAAKTNAAALTTAVSANAKKGLMNPITPRVVDPNAPKSAGNRDMLGTIFALQGAMSALTGATDGATSKVGLFSNALASTLGNVTTASFAFQGL